MLDLPATCERGPMMSGRPCAAILLLLSVWSGSLLLAQAEPDAGPSRAGELRRVQDDIARIERELQALAGREQGLLGELKRLDVELTLRQAECEELALRRAAIERQIEIGDRSIGDLERAQETRGLYLAFRLRETYKAGTNPGLRRLVGGEAAQTYWSGLHYAALLTERDAALIRSYRSDRARLAEERAGLERARGGLADVQAQAVAARDELDQARRRQSAMLARVQSDQTTRRAVLAELRAAAEDLGRVVSSLEPGSAPALDMRKFKGLLEWPAAGKLEAGFGTVVHPQFRTEVPHPGWDIAAPLGADVRAVFDGVVGYADWMRGYGLTLILDHGGGVITIYSHASALLAQRGDRVHRGQLVGKVGETASLRGPLLYFELRVDGRPVDPADWLRRP